MKDKLHCRICDSTLSDAGYFTVKENMFGVNEEFGYYLCPHCGCLQIEAHPGNMGRYYPEYYYSFGRQNAEPGSLRKKFYKIRSRIALTGFYSLLKSVNQPHLLKLIHYGNIQYDDKILDVGCGSGELLFDFLNYGYMNLTGIDPFLKDIYNSKNLNLSRKNIFEIGGKFDVIIFNHSFEHIFEQNEVIEKVKELLSEDGLLLLRLPVVNYAFEEYKENWIQIDAPRHFFLHTPKSMAILLQKHGFNIKHIIYDSDEYQFWGSEQCKKGISLNNENSYLINPSESIFSDKDINSYRKKANKLNRKGLGDQASFFIRRFRA